MFIDLPLCLKLIFCVNNHHQPVHPLVCRAATNFLHPCLSWAKRVRVPHECCMAFISFSTVLLHVVLGLPLFLFPSGVQCKAVLVIDWGSLLRTCPIHFHRRLVMMVPMSSCLHLFSRSSLEIFWGQNMRRILRRHVVWKDRSLLRSASVILQHSDPYRSVDITQLR